MLTTSYQTTDTNAARAAMGAPDALNNIPLELRSRRQWVCFDADKVPVDASSGANAKSNDSGTWSHFDQARRALARIGRARGVGFVFTDADPYCGIDLDSCFDQNGDLLSWAGDVLEAVRGLAYVERSLSGSGLHVILRGRAGRNCELNLGPHTGIEVYDSHPLIFTGDVWPGSVSSLPPAQHALDAILTEFFPAPAPSTPAARQTYTPNAARTQGYGAAALRLELDDLARATEGDRNNTLNRAAFSLGQLVAGGELDLVDVEGALLAGALGIGLAERESRATIASGLRAGMLEPRNAPARPQPAPRTPAPAPVVPWRITAADWAACPECGAWHHGAGFGGGTWSLFVTHHACRRAACPTNRKLHAGDVLGGVETWGDLVAARIEAKDWRKTRDRLKVICAGRSLGIEQPDGALVVIFPALYADALPGALPATWADAFAAAMNQAPGTRTRKPHAPRAAADAGVFFGPLPHAETMTGTGADDFAALSQGERLAVLTVDNDAAQPGELEAIRKALKLALPADWSGDLRALWLRAGFAVDDKTRTATGDTAAAKRLIAEFDAIRAELRARRQLAHKVGSSLYALSDENRATAAQIGAPDDARGAPGGVLRERTRQA